MSATSRLSGFGKVAVVHDWLSAWGGAELVLDRILRLFPGADLFCLFDGAESPERQQLSFGALHTSPLQRVPFVGRFYRALLPLMPRFVEQWDFSAYDLVISSSHAVAKGVIVPPEATHVCYIHSPMRFAWDMQGAYSSGAPEWLYPAIFQMRQVFLHRLRLWDQLSSMRVDHFIANSAFVAKRVQSYYRRDASVLYPPVRTDLFVRSNEPRQDFFLVVSRLVPHKRIDLLVDAFAGLPDQRLVIVGDGPEGDRLKRRATENVVFRGWLPTAEVVTLMQRARAFCSAAIEDCGIAVLEAQACGTPVIALAIGGTGETMAANWQRPNGGRNALLVPEQSRDAFQAAIQMFLAQEDEYSVAVCRENAERFSLSSFQNGLTALISDAISRKHRPGAGGRYSGMPSLCQPDEAFRA